MLRMSRRSTLLSKGVVGLPCRRSSRSKPLCVDGAGGVPYAQEEQ